MRIGIDHLVIAVPDPDRAAAELEARVGLRAGDGGRHETEGTFNRLVWLGDSYLELIGVWDQGLAARSWIGEPAIRALEAGGGLATWALASDDLDADVARLRAQGATLDGPRDGERRRPDGRIVRWRLADPPRLGPDQPPFWIQHDLASAEWTPGERAARAVEEHPLGGPCRLEVLELPVTDARSVAARSMVLLRSTGLRFRPSLAGRGARDADLGRGQRSRLLPAAPDGLPTVRLVAAAAEAFEVDALGLRWSVRRGAVSTQG